MKTVVLSLLVGLFMSLPACGSTGEQITDLQARLDALQPRLEAAEGKLDSLGTKLGQTDDKIATLEPAISRVADQSITGKMCVLRAAEVCPNGFEPVEMSVSRVKVGTSASKLLKPEPAATGEHVYPTVGFSTLACSNNNCKGREIDIFVRACCRQ